MASKGRHSSSLAIVSWLGALSILLGQTLPTSFYFSRALAQQPTSQVSQEQLAKIARSITVKIVTKDSGGSGILINKNGQEYSVLTNQHVIDKNKKYSIQTSDGRIHQVKLSNLNFQGKDLALLKFRSTINYPVAFFSNLSDVAQGDEVFAAGFPFEDNSSEARAFVLTTGRVSTLLPKPLEGGYLIGYTSEVEKGMSGGPVLNKEGKVIGVNGIHAHALWGNPYIYEDGSRPNEELINQMRRSSWAVPIETLARMSPNLVPRLTSSIKPVTNPKTAPTPQLASQINQTAQEISVLITWETSNGSGVIIAREGNTYYVLTAGHVAGETRNLKIITPDGQNHLVEKSKIKNWKANGLDLALLSFSSQQTYKVARLGDYNLAIEDDRVVFVSGWPESGKTTATTLKSNRWLTAGYLLDKDRGINLARDDRSFSLAYELVYTNVTEKGMSGGPILDTDGRLIGIHTAAEAVQGEQLSPIPERTNEEPKLELGYSLGIPIRTFLAKISQEKIALNLTVEKSSPHQLTAAQEDQIVSSSLKLEEPERNATEIDWLNYGNKLWRLRRYEESLQAFDKALAKKPNFYEAWYAKGMALMRQKNYSEAKKAFKEALKYNPDSDQAQRQLGDAFWYSGEYEEARQAFEKAIELRPDDFILYNWLAQALEKLGRYPEALQANDKSIRYNSHNAESYVRRAATRRELNDYEGAIADLNEAIRLQPDYAYAYQLRGYHRSEQNNFSKEQALADLNKALQLQPNDAMTYADRGIIYAKIGDRQKFTADFNKALSLKPDDAWIYYNRAYARKLLGDYQGALADYTEAIRLAPEEAYQFYKDRAAVHSNKQAQLEDYTRAIRLKPNYVQAYINRGIAYAEIGNSKKFVEDINQALRFQPNNAWIYQNRGYGYYLLGEPEQGSKDYDKAISLNRVLAYQSYNERGISRYKRKDYQGAIADYTEAIRLKPDYVQYYLNRGDAYAKAGNKAKAMEDFATALRLRPNDASTYIYRGEAYFALKENEQGIKDYETAIGLAPESAYIYYKNRGVLRYGQKDYAAAVADYTQSLRLKPDYATAYFERGKAYFDWKKYEEALADLNKVIEIAPDAAVAYGVRGMTYYHKREYEKAIADSTKAIELKVERKSLGMAYLVRALAYSRLGNYEAAIAGLTEEIRLNFDDPQISASYSIRGMFYDKLGQYKEALADYNESLRINPKDIISYETRAELLEKLGRKQEARADWEKAAQLYLEKGDKDSSQFVLERARKL